MLKSALYFGLPLGVLAATLGARPIRSDRRLDRHTGRGAVEFTEVLRSWMPIPHRELHGTIWQAGRLSFRLQSDLVGDLRAGAHERAYRSRFPCADYRAYWEYGGARLGCQADHRSPVKRPQPRRSTISCVGPLQALGYAYMPQYEAWLPGELFFRKGLSGPWTHHLHILQGDDPRCRTVFCFVTICATIRVARAYAKLKRDLAAAFDDDISGYRNAKNAFVAATMAEVRADGDREP